MFCSAHQTVIFSVVLALKSSYFSISCQIDVKYFSILVFYDAPYTTHEKIKKKRRQKKN